MDINHELADQLAWHWNNQWRSRVSSLSDAEYFWEPAPGCWSVRPAGQSTAPIAAGSGDFTIDFAIPEPDPAPLTTIAWRLSHILVGVLGARNASHFSGPEVSYESYDYPSTAAEAIERLDVEYQRWIGGVRSLGTEGLDVPCGEPGYENSPMAALVLHINREMIHHCAEIALLRDLYAHTVAVGTPVSRGAES